MQLISFLSLFATEEKQRTLEKERHLHTNQQSPTLPVQKAEEKWNQPPTCCCSSWSLTGAFASAASVQSGAAAASPTEQTASALTLPPCAPRKVPLPIDHLARYGRLTCPPSTWGKIPGEQRARGEQQVETAAATLVVALHSSARLLSPLRFRRKKFLARPPAGRSVMQLKFSLSSSSQRQPRRWWDAVEMNEMMSRVKSAARSPLANR